MNKSESVANEVFSPAVSNVGNCSNSNDLAHQDAAGAYLRDARLSQGLDIAALAGLLKVPVSKLQALEQGRFESLPDPVFTRALASSMCRILKLDPAPMLQQLPAITTFKAMPQNRGINAPFRTRSSRQGIPVWSHVSRPAILLGLALLLGALVLVFLPFIEQEFNRLQNLGHLEVNPAQVAQSESVTTTVVSPISRNDGVEGAVENSASSNLTTDEVLVAVPGPAMLTAPPTPVPIVTFTAKDASSIKVTDAYGTIIFDRVLRAGESAGLSGSLPLSTVVGRANAVQVLVRGEAFDLGAVSKNNTARFEVK